MIRLNDVMKARDAISGITHMTPILKSEQLSRVCGNQVYLKGEHLQRTGSFKIRGATNKVKRVFKEGATAVVTASSGNHGQAVAYIANQLSIPATIVIPTDTSLCKIDAIKAYNGNIIKFGTTTAERLPKAKKVGQEIDAVYIPPYDDPHIMAGQGTIGLELLEQLDDIDMILVPIGGGGLISGILTAIKELKPSIQVIGVEPLLANDTYLSLKKGEMTSITRSTTIADGLRSSQPGELTFPILKKYLDDLVLIKEEEIRYAFTFVLERMKQMIEPSSATTVACAMFEKIPVKNKKMVCVISGGNVDLQMIPNLTKI